MPTSRSPSGGHTTPTQHRPPSRETARPGRGQACRAHPSRQRHPFRARRACPPPSACTNAPSALRAGDFDPVRIPDPRRAPAGRKRGRWTNRVRRPHSDRVRCGGLATRSSSSTHLISRAKRGRSVRVERWAVGRRDARTSRIDRASCARRACPRPGRAFSWSARGALEELEWFAGRSGCQRR